VYSVRSLSNVILALSVRIDKWKKGYIGNEWNRDRCVLERKKRCIDKVRMLII
jgi:hypothetical protein